MKELYEAYKKAREEMLKAHDEYYNFGMNKNNYHKKVSEFTNTENQLVKELGDKVMIIGNTVILADHGCIEEKEIL